MRRRLFTLLVVAPALVAGLAAPAGASAAGNDWSGWDHVHWVPTDVGPGLQCGVPFVSMHPTGFVDFWVGRVDAQGVQGQVQHWDGAMEFTGPTGSTVVVREDDWRFVTRTYTSADQSTYRETSRLTGLLEQLIGSDGARRVTDAGSLTMRTENVAVAPGWYVITSLETVQSAGALPIRRGGYDLDLQGWTRECQYFVDHLK
jgi:hypothetical protein